METPPIRFLRSRFSFDFHCLIFYFQGFFLSLTQITFVLDNLFSTLSPDHLYLLHLVIIFVSKSWYHQPTKSNFHLLSSIFHYLLCLNYVEFVYLFISLLFLGLCFSGFFSLSLSGVMISLFIITS